MSEHPKANALAENVYLRLLARLSMVFAVPAFGIALNWIAEISDAQDEQRTFQATQKLEMELVKQRIEKLENGDERKSDGNAQVLQRLTAVESLIKRLADEGASTRQSIDNLTGQLIRERRSDAGEIPSRN